MSKRFTDTEKWKKRFIRNLSSELKLLWLYILDDCDHAGIWHVDFDVARIKLGISTTEDEAKEKLGDKISSFDDGEKWFIPAFIEFQYGVLNPGNRAHNSVIQQLNKYSLNKPLTSPLQEAMDKDKDKVKAKVKDKDKDKGAYGELGLVKLTDEEYSKLLSKHGKKVLELGIEELDTYIGSKGVKYKNHYATMKSNSWVWDRVRENGVNVDSKPQSAPKPQPLDEFGRAEADIIKQLDAAMPEDVSRTLSALNDKYGDMTYKGNKFITLTYQKWKRNK